MEPHQITQEESLSKSIRTQIDFEQVYLDIKTPGIVYQHKYVDTSANDYADIYEIAVDNAKFGAIVYILPVFQVTDPLWLTVFEGAKERKCPDLKINGIFTEVKTATDKLSDNKISKCIRNCHQQANQVIVRLPSTYNIYRLQQIAKGRFKIHDDLQVIEFKIENKYIKFGRSAGSL